MQARVTLPADRTAPAAARAWVAEVGAALEPRILDDLRLIVTELVTNAVKYGPGEPVHVCLHIRPPHVVRGVVIDMGEHAHHIRLRSPDPEATGGRGLRIVARLAHSWGVHEGSTHVWFTLGRAQP
jgi:anti-sigma regulatory factor (Ser/Thr protein kinase)